MAPARNAVTNGRAGAASANWDWVSSNLPDRDASVLRHILESRARDMPERVYARFEDGSSWTYAQTLEHARRAAAAFARLGVVAGDVVLAFCWSHSRRKFYDIQAATPAPIAAEALMRIATLYTIEDDIRGRSAEERKQARQQRSKPIVEALHVWLQDKLKTVSAKSTIAEAIRYSLSRWEGLERFLDDGRIEIDSNVVERGMRTIALGRKNHLFAGSDYGAEHWAIIASLLETCKMNRVDPQAYLRDVLAKIVARHPMSRIDELLPFAYRPMQAEKAAA